MEMSLACVQQLIASAIEQASNEFKRPICVALCDSAGFLLSFTRMPGATLRSIPIAQAKAYTAAYMGISTEAFAERLLRESVPASFFSDARLTGLPGGAVLKNSSGVVIGAAGVSGLTPQQDQSIANSLAELCQKGSAQQLTGRP